MCPSFDMITVVKAVTISRANCLSLLSACLSTLSGLTWLWTLIRSVTVLRISTSEALERCWQYAYTVHKSYWHVLIDYRTGRYIATIEPISYRFRDKRFQSQQQQQLFHPFMWPWLSSIVINETQIEIFNSYCCKIQRSDNILSPSRALWGDGCHFAGLAQDQDQQNERDQ